MIAGGLFAGGGLADAYKRVVFEGVFDYRNVSTTFYQNQYSINLPDTYIFASVTLNIFAPIDKEKT